MRTIAPPTRQIEVGVIPHLLLPIHLAKGLRCSTAREQGELGLPKNPSAGRGGLQIEKDHLKR